MRRNVATPSGRSLKTLFIYSGIVILFIAISLLIKMFFVVRASKYDGVHHFTVDIIKNKKVKEILVFNPDTNTINVVTVAGSSVTPELISKLLLVIPDGTITLPDSYSLNQNAAQDMLNAIVHYPLIATNLTMYDLIRLYSLARSVSPENTNYQDVSAENISQVPANIFLDNQVSQENITIQIINATNTVGLGSHLSQILSLFGANVVEVSTALNTQQDSKIQYFGPQSYTLQRLSQLLPFPVSRLKSQTVADIVITLGINSSSLLPF